ncbi:cation diffusion facilitator family transporter [Tropheryma whipplei]|uniref:Cation efflux protein n=1 Tax=Tropheryma whipplei (strain Twist) TaxID=203267 RepID=Q83MV9_TROWT|nr:cation diffusion facilitator family transporter [Tropheryma whipplei]AAO44517.1 cation efflux protein [Tropheryma whipplei str. Twist]CAD67020.1 putative cation efflux protein [Tropheryma whipplei TW08/27]
MFGVLLHGHTHSSFDVHINVSIYKRLFIALCLTVGFTLIELLAVYLSASVTLASDAGHMFIDSLGLFNALIAARLVAKSNRNSHRTYGLYRVEVFSAGVSILIMFFLAFLIAKESIMRLVYPEEHISGWVIFVTGIAGLLVNLSAVLVLHSAKQKGINLRAAYMEVLSDAIASVSVMLSAILIILTGLTIIDSIAAIAIVLFICYRAAKLGKEVIRILLQASPVDIQEVESSLLGIDGVISVDHLHAWTLSDEKHIATANILIHKQTDQNKVLVEAERILYEQYGILHTTLQISPMRLESRLACGGPVISHR